MTVWDWSVFFSNLVHPAIIRGLWTTVWLTFVTLVLAILVGAALALVGRSRHRVAQWVYQGYVAFFRATPLLVQLVFLYSALPQMGIRLTVIQAAIIGLTLSESPYVAEIVRSALSAVPVGQWEAARAIGLRPIKIMSAIVFPQALRIAVPPLGNEFVRQLKNTRPWCPCCQAWGTSSCRRARLSFGRWVGSAVSCRASLNWSRAWRIG